MARQFTATSQHRIDIANESAFDFDKDDAFSIATWLYIPANGYMAIFAKALDGVDAALLFQVHGFVGPRLVLDLRDDLGNRLRKWSPDGCIPLGQWCHVGVTYDGSNDPSGITYYVNGVVPTGTVTGTDTSTLTNSILNDGQLQMGAANGPTVPALFLDGSIGDGGFWGAELSPTDMAQLAGRYAPTLVQNGSLVSCWPLDTGTSPEDDLKGSNDGTVVGAVSVVGPLTATTAPVISGTPQVGQTLSVSNGVWRESPSSFAYQWQRADDVNFTSGVTNIGTNSSSYTLVSADDGKYVRCQVKPTNTLETATFNTTPVTTASVASWSPEISVGSTANGSKAFAADGKKVYFAYDSGGTVFVKRSDDEGQTWGSAVTVETSSSLPLDRPLIVDPVTSRVHVLYMSSSGVLKHRYSDDSGATWSSAHSLHTVAAGSPIYRVALTAYNGIVNAAYVPGSSTTNEGLWTARSTNGGSSFAADVHRFLTLTLPLRPDMCRGADGSLHLTLYNPLSGSAIDGGQALYARSPDDGATWPTNMTVLPNAGTNDWGRVSIATSDGVVLIVGMKPFGNAINSGIYLVRSADNGASWVGPTQIEAPNDDSHPWVEMCGKFAGILWINRTGTPGISRYVESGDYGANWGPVEHPLVYPAATSDAPKLVFSRHLLIAARSDGTDVSIARKGNIAFNGGTIPTKIDDFNRSNGAIGSDWNTWYADPLEINSNAARVSNAGSFRNAVVWVGTTNPDWDDPFEVHALLKVVSGPPAANDDWNIYLGDSTTQAAFNGYRIELRDLSPWQMTLFEYAAGVVTSTLLQVSLPGGAPTTGDEWRIHRYNDEFLLFYKRSGGAWQLIGTWIDATTQGPYFLALDLTHSTIPQFDEIDGYTRLVPSNTAAPVASGTVALGSVISVTQGSWTGDPYDWLYQWQISTDGGLSWQDIPLAELPFFTVANPSFPHRCCVRARNAAGDSAPACSNSLGSTGAPGNSSPPTITGSPVGGTDLTRTSQGTWVGSPTPSLTQNWQRDVSPGVYADIAGATGNTYTITAADSGHNLRLRVTGTNVNGTTNAYSNVVGVVGNYYTGSILRAVVELCSDGVTGLYDPGAPAPVAEPGPSGQQGPLPYLDFCGTEIANAARTVQYLRNGLGATRHGEWVVSEGDVCSVLYRLGVTDFFTPNFDPAPWYDAGEPGSGAFLGLILLDIEGYDSVITRQAAGRIAGLQGGVLYGEQRAAREWKFRAALVSNDDDGASFGLRWLTSVLKQDACEVCSGCYMIVRLACPPDDGTDDLREEWISYDAALASGPTETARFSPGVDDSVLGGCRDLIVVEWTMIAGNPYLYQRPIIRLAPTVIGVATVCTDICDYLFGDPGTPVWQNVSPPSRGTLGAIFTLQSGSGMGAVLLESRNAPCGGGGPTGEPDHRIEIRGVPAGAEVRVDSAQHRIDVTYADGTVADGIPLVILEEGKAVDWIEVRDCDAVTCLSARTSHPCSQGDDTLLTIETQLRQD